MHKQSSQFIIMSFDWSKFWSRNFLLEHSFIIKDDAIITVSQLRMMQSFLSTMIQNIKSNLELVHLSIPVSGAMPPRQVSEDIHSFKDPLNIT